MEILGVRLRETREKRALSQSKLGCIAGCGQEKISSYEIGKIQPRYSTLIRLADTLQVSMDYLLGRTDEMERRVSLNDVLVEDEIDLILRYRALPQDKKLKLLGIIIGLGE